MFYCNYTTTYALSICKNNNNNKRTRRFCFMRKYFQIDENINTTNIKKQTHIFLRLLWLPLDLQSFKKIHQSNVTILKLTKVVPETCILQQHGCKYFHATDMSMGLQRTSRVHPSPLLKVLFECDGIDLTEQFHQSACGHHFQLVWVDYAMQYLKLCHWAAFLQRVWQRCCFWINSWLGVPKKDSNQGTLFMFCTLKGPVSITQTKRLVMQLNKSLKFLICKFIHEDECNWD